MARWLGLGLGRSGCTGCGRRRADRRCAAFGPVTATARITQGLIIRARRLPITAILRRRLAILRQRLAMRRRPALPLATQWPTARSVTGPITRKPEPISGPTANDITVPERPYKGKARS